MVIILNNFDCEIRDLSILYISFLIKILFTLLILLYKIIIIKEKKESINTSHIFS